MRINISIGKGIFEQHLNLTYLFLFNFVIEITIIVFL